MFDRFRNLSGLSRLCLVLCIPIWLGIAAYYFLVVEDAPEVTFRVWVADEKYSDVRDLQLVYTWNFVTGQQSPSNQWMDALYSMPTIVPGYQVHGCSRWTQLCWVQVSKKLTADRYEQAQQDALALYQVSADARYWKQFHRAALWLLLGTAPLLLFWIVVLVGRWVRAGFAGAAD